MNKDEVGITITMTLTEADFSKLMRKLFSDGIYIADWLQAVVDAKVASIEDTEIPEYEQEDHDETSYNARIPPDDSRAG